MRAKLTSLLVAAVALVASWWIGASSDETVALSTLVVSIAPVFVLFGLLAIWLSPYFGSFSGPLFRGGFVDSPTPEAAFVWFGYLLLALPLLAFLWHVVAHATRTI